VPSGRVHNTINTLAFLALAGGYGGAYTAGAADLEFLPAVAFSLSYFAGTFLLSPDLDFAEGHVSSKRNWGPLGFLWVPYGWLMSHRGLSHTWLVGPLTRLAYLAVLLAAPVFVLREPLSLLGLDRATLVALTVGYYLSQWLHLVADGVYPDMRAPGSRPRRRR